MKRHIFTVLTLVLLAEINCLVVDQKATSPNEIRMSGAVKAVHPDYPWFNYSTCPGFVENEYLELIDYSFEEAPTAGQS